MIAETRTSCPGKVAAVLAGAGALVGLLGGYLIARPRLAVVRTRLRTAEWRADHDALTGLLNRDGAHRRCTAEPATGHLALLDLDGFKQLNDRHGHHAGDELLVVLAKRLHDQAQSRGGFSARLGGDEFLLHLPARGGISAEGIESAMESVLDALTAPATLDLPEAALTVQPRVSVGLTRRTGQPWAVDLRHADIALYQAKQHAEQRLVLHAPGMCHPGPNLPDDPHSRRVVRR